MTPWAVWRIEIPWQRKAFISVQRKIWEKLFCSGMSVRQLPAIADQALNRFPTPKPGFCCPNWHFHLHPLLERKEMLRYIVVIVSGLCDFRMKAVSCFKNIVIFPLCPCCISQYFGGSMEGAPKSVWLNPLTILVMQILVEWVNSCYFISMKL